MAKRSRHDQATAIGKAQARSKDVLSHADASGAQGKGIVLPPEREPQIVAQGSV